MYLWFCAFSPGMWHPHMESVSCLPDAHVVKNVEVGEFEVTLILHLN